MSVDVEWRPGDLLVVTAGEHLTAEQTHYLQKSLIEAVHWGVPIILPPGSSLKVFPQVRRYEERKATHHACHWNC